MRRSRKDIKIEALKLLVGKQLSHWVDYGDFREAVEQMAELIRFRKAKRGQTKIKRLYRPFRRKYDAKGSCSYCWPNCGSANYTIGRVSHTRSKNPKRIEQFLGEAC